MSPVRFVNPALMMPANLPELPITPLNYCTSRDGKFDDTTPAQMEAAIAAYLKVSDTKTLALFFHGGLVDKAGGLTGARTLIGPYSKPDDSGAGPGGNAYPYFFVWESGLFEVLQHHLPQISSEIIFQRLLDIVGSKSQKVLGGTVSATRSLAVLRTPSVGVTIGPVPPDKEASQVDVAEVESSVENDPLIQAEKKRIAARAVPVQTALAAARAAPARLVESSTVTLLSSDVVNAIVAEESQEDALRAAGIEALWSPVSVGILALRAGKALVRIVQRYAAARNHNFHNTVVEEILRQFYIADAGGRVWG